MSARSEQPAIEDGSSHLDVRIQAPLRVLYSFPHALGGPGIGTTAWHQVDQLVRKGHQVTLVVTSLARPVAEPARTVQTLHLAGRRISHRMLGVDRALAWHDLVTARLLRRAPDSFDVVHTWPLAGVRTMELARRLGVPAVREAPNTHTGHAYRVVAEEMSRLGLQFAADNPHRANAGRLAREQREWDLAGGILAPSEAVAESFRAAGLDHVLRHRYGYDPAQFPTGPGEGRRHGGSGLHAVFVGRAEPRKGLHHALAAWLNSTAARTGQFAIFGNFAPGYRELLNDQLSHPSVRTMGFSGAVARELRQADVLLLPTVEEGSALVTYEAMAAGCVPLVSDAAGAYLEPGVSGELHRVGDVATLTAQLDALAADPDRLARMSAAAALAARVLTWSDATEALVRAYQQVVLDRTPGRAERQGR